MAGSGTSSLKELFLLSASQLPAWEKLSRNECANAYLEAVAKNKMNLAESYLSALILKFWNILNRNYYTQEVKILNEQECYDILIDGIIKALNAHVWTDPNNVLYGDVNGPEKAINVCLMSTKINSFIAAGRDKRKINTQSYSIEKLEEDSSEGYYLPYFDADEITLNYIDTKIKKFIVDGNFLAGLILSLLININFFSRTEAGIEFDLGKLKRYLKNLTEEDLKIFALDYDFDLTMIKTYYNLVQSLILDDVDKVVKDAFNLYKNDAELTKYLGVNQEDAGGTVRQIKLW